MSIKIYDILSNLRDSKATLSRTIKLIAFIFIVLLISFSIWMYFSDAKTKSFYNFWTEWGHIISLICTIILALFPIIDNIIDSAYKRKFLIHFSNKEHIKLLDKFGYNTFSGHKSIYKNVISMFKNCLDLISKENNKVDIYLLLCSPAFDYPERVKGNFKLWGAEFLDLIRAIINTKQNINNVVIYYLPPENIYGFNPLKNFNEVLSNYCYDQLKEKQKSRITAGQIFHDIDLQTNRIIQNINELNFNEDYPLTANKIALLDIPFQIFLYKSETQSEVVVSFAGKSIIESDSNIDPKGFQSSDDDVVSWVSEIFDSYVDEHRRMPIKPNHTLEIIKVIENNDSHLIENYLGHGFDVLVEKNVFSPAFANSSKFASDVLYRYIDDKNTQVFDLGSGTGVQAMIAYKKLKDLGNDNPYVFAIEPCVGPYNNLIRNMMMNKYAVVTKQWEMKAELKIEGHIKTLKPEELCKNNFSIIGGELYHMDSKYVGQFSGVLTDVDDNRVDNIFNKEHKRSQFDIIIADLPFVDTSSSDDFQRAFFDENHFLHFTLFSTFNNSNWVKENAILLTTFSTLGGPEDVCRFERMILKNNLIPIQKQIYLEDDYHWIVYLIKKNSRENFPVDYWRDKFVGNIKQIEKDKKYHTEI